MCAILFSFVDLGKPRRRTRKRKKKNYKRHSIKKIITGVGRRRRGRRRRTRRQCVQRFFTDQAI
jgi:hypothetical protein